MKRSDRMTESNGYEHKTFVEEAAIKAGFPEPEIEHLQHVDAPRGSAVLVTVHRFPDKRISAEYRSQAIHYHAEN